MPNKMIPYQTENLVALFGSNFTFIADLFEKYLENPKDVDSSWRSFFDDFLNGKLDVGKLETRSSMSAESREEIATYKVNGRKFPEEGGNSALYHSNNVFSSRLAEGDKYQKISGVFLKIAENMQKSLDVPTATSLSTLPAKLLEENRLLINQYLAKSTGEKISYTHLIAYAIVQAIKKHPSINTVYGVIDKKPSRIWKDKVNLGIAVDIQKKDRSRVLLVPSIKDAGTMNFREFVDAYDDILLRARNGKLLPDDFSETTISLSNPGTIGTVSSTPRLMPNQACIIAIGAIQYTAEHQAMNPDVLAELGASKVMNITNTYDHRVIQGVESGEFLSYIIKLLLGENKFYTNIFKGLHVPHRPWSYKYDKSSTGFKNRRSDDAIEKQVIVTQMINAYRVRGHLQANTNPLGQQDVYYMELDPEYYGLTIWDLDREFFVTAFGRHERMKLRNIIENLRNTYCQKIGIEYMHMQDTDKKRWVTESIELVDVPITKDDKTQALQNLIRADVFEKFIHTKFVGHKRFSIEGGEGALVCLDEALQHLTKFNVEEAVIGMAHRGRINILCNLVGKPYEEVFSEFEGKNLSLDDDSGDVKYHLGAVGKKKWEDDEEMIISVAANPSHLEAVSPVVLGIVRAKQDRLKEEKKRDRVVPVLIHGDAAFTGQGVVSETLNMSELRAYKVGGTIHIIVNNQIGFTTLPIDSRSTTYASDIAKSIQAPIFHVNGDSIDACIMAARWATEFRSKFHTDIVIDIVCYRKYGHSESDDPTYTQPVMYKKINKHPSVLDIYSKELIREGFINEDGYKKMVSDFENVLESCLEQAKSKPKQDLKIERVVDLTLAVKQEDIVNRYRISRPSTAVSLKKLQSITETIFKYPEGFSINSKLSSQLFKRKDVLSDNPMLAKVDWGFSETLALGSLCLEGTPVRFCGQDTRRGTFSQRHLELYDTDTAMEYIPLCHVSKDQAPLYVYNSHLSEYAALGFEFGYSVADPLALTIWEAQFGDFANGAQVVIDQFISSSEAKWEQPTGLVLLLPHGFEGQGPEHSSARLERFLQLCGEVNMQVCNCTTPAQYFHLLRRQIIAGNIKPLIIMTPKSILRHSLAVSRVEELVNGKFHNVLDMEHITVNSSNVKRVLLCSGKIYYDLVKYAKASSITYIAILRVEQLYPYPEIRVRKLLDKYSSASEVCWVQEEPKNMGAWSFIAPYLMEQITKKQTLRYIGRKAAASPATGFFLKHDIEQNSIVKESLLI